MSHLFWILHNQQSPLSHFFLSFLVYRDINGVE